jgi:Holliday junction resolvase-like predicted endonuclease
MSQQALTEVQEIWALFKDTDRRMKETSEQIREVARRQEELTKQQEETSRDIRLLSRENDSRFKDLRELFTGQWGKLVEALVEPSVLKLFQERGIQVIDTAQRLKTTKNGEQMEIDILATNKDSVIVVEVKTTLKVEDVNDFISEKLSRFFEFFPKYKGMTLYGAVAGIRIEESADRYAYRKGLFVLTLSGEGMVVILNDEKFRPNEW